jgi:outer membrane protein assembly factor BamB
MNLKIRKYFCLAILYILSGTACKKTSAPAPEPLPDKPDTTVIPILVDNKFYSVTGADSSSPEGEILLAMNSGTEGKLFILDQRGSIKKEKSVGVHAENFQKWVVAGQTRYSYFHTEGDFLLDSIAGTELGYQEICDSNLNILSTVKLIPNGEIDTATQDKLDTHEFILLGDNHYIYETYYVESPGNIPDSLNPAPGVKVAACIIQEVNNGQVVFQWNGTKYPEFYAASQENNDFSDKSVTHDYMHLNSICVDSADNNLIVSFRNLNEIVKLNRQTGEIMWRLGGDKSDFPQTPDQLFLRQHFPRLIENGRTLIFVDNGLDSIRPYSRILEFQLDENNKTITSFTSFKVPDRFIQFAGSVRKEGSNYFIGGGSANYALEVNYTTGETLFRINQKYPSYRAMKY